ncbi:MAG: MmgE/PrpD family protein [Actinobacteria bacterium]|nr:MmgE/PrpD family protein [Actinomycetota bacterium]
MDALTTKIAEFAAQTRYDDLPAAVCDAARTRIVDAIGCAIGGRTSPTLATARPLLLSVGTEAAAADGALLGWQLGRARADLPLDLAAFANTTMIRYLDFNDWYPGGHPSDTLGGLIALAGAAGVSGRRLIAATVVSYEVFIRLQIATEFRRRGFDQGFSMGVATVAAMGNLLGLDAATIGAAIGIIAASGVPTRATRSGTLSMWKGCATAYAVRNAAFLVQLAAAGMTGPPAPFEGRNGIWDLLTGEFRLEPFGTGVADFKITRTSLKYWPVCFHLQAAVWAGVQLREQADLDSVESLTVGTYWEAWRDTGSEPDKWEPMTRETADHSLPYGLAYAAQHGGLDARAFEPSAYRDDQVRALMSRITVAVDDEVQAAFPDKSVLRLQAVDGAGKRTGIEVVNPAGHVDNPLTHDQVRDKFIALAAPALGGQPEAAGVFDAWWSITDDGAPVPMSQTILPN